MVFHQEIPYRVISRYGECFNTKTPSVWYQEIPYRVISRYGVFGGVFQHENTISMVSRNTVKNIPHHFKVVGKFFVLLGVFEGCATIRAPQNCYKFNDFFIVCMVFLILPLVSHTWLNALV